MIDVRMEIEKLKFYLESRDLHPRVVNDILLVAEGEISSVISSSLEIAMEQAVQAGEEMGADDFVQEIKAISMSSSIMVTTDSGRMDFSEPPVPMLPSLLKNAKIASDGSRYKVIPLKPKSNSPKTTGGTVDALRALDQARIVSASGRQARKHGERAGTRDILDQAAAMSGIFNSRPKIKSEKHRQSNNAPAVDFKTASSKQDPNTQWVKPEVKKDMTPILQDINEKLQSRIRTAVYSVINKYKEMY